MSRHLLTTPDARIELHLHLEGAAPVNFIRLLADSKGIWRAPLMNITGPPFDAYTFHGFEDFLRVYGQVASVLQTPLEYYDLVHKVMERQAETGVLYTEVFLSPDLCGGGDLAAWRDYLAAIEQAARDAEAIHGTILRGIVTAIRHLGPSQSQQVAICAAETAGDFVVAFGLAGDERVLRPRDFAWAFDAAREAELGLTAHAGELGRPQAIVDTLDALRVSRIGHGIAALGDARAMNRLIEDDIVLECCPGSNVALGLVDSYLAHPIGQLRDRGVKVTISTDDPPFFRTDMDREYIELGRSQAWNERQFREANRIAAKAAFCDAATRGRLVDTLEGRRDG